MGKNDLVTIQEFAKLAGVSRQAVYKQLNNRLHSYCQLVDNQKMRESRLSTYNLNWKKKEHIIERRINSSWKHYQN